MSSICNTNTNSATSTMCNTNTNTNSATSSICNTLQIVLQVTQY